MTLEEGLNSCLADLFHVPTHGIENAFKLVLDMMHAQEAKYEELAREHAELRMQNILLLGNVKDIQKSCDGMLEQSKQNKVILTSLETLKLDTRDMTETVKAMKRTQSFADKDLHNLKEEVKVCLYQH